MKTRRLRNLFTASFAVTIAVCGFGLPPAAAAPPPTPSIDLSHGWGRFNRCVVADRGKVECFTNDAEFASRTNQLAATTSSNCPVRLFRGNAYTGQQLALYVEGVWVNLSDFGFDNGTVSFIGSGCGFHMAEYQWGGGWWYPGYTGAWAATPNMGASWNYRVSSIYIN